MSVIFRPKPTVLQQMCFLTGLLLRQIAQGLYPFLLQPPPPQYKSLFQDYKGKWSDIRPSMVTHTLNSCSAFNPSKVHTQSSEHTHTLNTHPERWAAFYAAAPGEQLWVLAQGHLSRGIEGRESAVHSLPPPTIPAGPRLELSITSPTLQPLCHDFHKKWHDCDYNK